MSIQFATTGFGTLPSPPRVWIRRALGACLLLATLAGPSVWAASMGVANSRAIDTTEAGGPPAIPSVQHYGSRGHTVTLGMPIGGHPTSFAVATLRHFGSRGHAASAPGPAPEFRLPQFDDPVRPMVPTADLAAAPFFSHAVAVLPGRRQHDPALAVTQRAPFHPLLRHNVLNARLPETKVFAASVVLAASLQARAPPSA